MPSRAEYASMERNFIRRVRTDAALAAPSIVAAEPPFATGPVARLADCDYWGWSEDEVVAGDSMTDSPAAGPLGNDVVARGKMAAAELTADGNDFWVADWERVSRVLAARHLRVEAECMMRRVEDEQGVYRQLMSLFDDLQSDQNQNNGEDELLGALLMALTRQRDYIGELRKTRRDCLYAVKQASQLLHLLAKHRPDPECDP